MGYKVVVVGATGLASRRSLGTEVSFGDKTLTTKDLDQFDFTGWDMAPSARTQRSNMRRSRPRPAAW